MSKQTKSPEINPVESMGLLSDKLDELANIALDRRRSSGIGTPEWDYEEGRRNGLRTAQKLLLAILADNDTDDSRKRKD